MRTIINVKGLHCGGCKRIIEEEISQMTGVTSIMVDLKTNQATINYSSDVTIDEIINKINDLNYQASLDKKPDNRKNIYYFIGIIALFAGLFAVSEYLGWFSIMENLNNQNIGYGLIFIIGLLASLHCVGMCGGLILSYASKAGGSNLPHWQYNIGRIISYSVIGGLLGGLGSLFNINPTLSGILMIGAGLTILIMGLSFVFDFKLPTSRLPFSKSLSSYGPLTIGLLTGLMPCGPLQAMQLYSLGTGSAIKGGLSMLVYGLGTTPLIFGFGKTINKINNSKISLFLKLSGIIIIIMSLVMINRGSLNFGYGFVSEQTSKQITKDTSHTNQNVQIIKMDLTYNGYSPNTLRIRAGVPVRWIINVKEMSGCTDSIILHGHDIKKDLKYGENIIEFTPKDGEKEIKFSCWMKMVWGKFIIDDKPSDTCTINENCDTK